MCCIHNLFKLLNNKYHVKIFLGVLQNYYQEIADVS